MQVYAGIDEAGYGPLLGPLLVARTVFTAPPAPPATPATSPVTSTPAAGAASTATATAAPNQRSEISNQHSSAPALWHLLRSAVCRSLADRRAARRGHIAVADSKKLTTAAAGLRHLELGCLAFAGLAGRDCPRVDDWLSALGETCHHDLAALPWYTGCDGHPWQPLPDSVTADELAIARNMLTRAAGSAGVALVDFGAAVVFEDRFNQMVAATRSKAATSFTFVSRHLRAIWDEHGQAHPRVVVDRQGGRTRYLDPLALAFPDARIAILDESDGHSAYRLVAGERAMTVSFEVDAEDRHLPVALASMICKYTRELLMARLNAWFIERVPGLAPTAGYATDGRRFMNDLAPHLARLNIDPARLCRQA
ncbi:MAG: hypothetical protein WD009_13835 [Phycisphaeraceae bacterium]